MQSRASVETRWSLRLGLALALLLVGCGGAPTPAMSRPSGGSAQIVVKTYDTGSRTWEDA
jgi:hypothetical protein